MRVFLSVILLTIISFQVLPVKKISKSFFKGMTTEEVQDAQSNAPEDDAGNQFNNFDSYFRSDYFYELSYTRCTDDPATLCFLYTEPSLQQFIPDKDTPPPNLS